MKSLSLGTRDLQQKRMDLLTRAGGAPLSSEGKGALNSTWARAGHARIDTAAVRQLAHCLALTPFRHSRKARGTHIWRR